MTKVKAIKKVLEDHNGIATWNIIYSEIEKYYPSIKVPDEWEAGIRGVLYREIKNGRNFKRVGFSLYSLLDYKEEKFEDVKQEENIVRMHSFMEGICIEIGNFLNLKTFTADPTGIFNNLTLSKITTLKEVPAFSYQQIVDYAKRIDVLWFNEKGYQFPKRAIEIVDSIGTLEPALKRTLQLIEFNLNFYLLCKSEHISKIEKEINAEPFARVKERYKVRDYESILNIYENPLANKEDDFLKIQNHF